MAETLAYLRELNMVSLALRLLLAAMLGGFIGLERGRKRRPAGFRTYMLVCLGAALTMLIGQYNYTMLHSTWAELAQALVKRLLSQQDALQDSVLTDMMLR